MIDNFEHEDFERTLKEHADRFYLTPSVRVWKSIYNDLHPGSKWPSLAVGLFMILTLFWIGNTHTNGPGDEAASPEKTVSPSGNNESGLAPVVPIDRTLQRSQKDEMPANRRDLSSAIPQAKSESPATDGTVGSSLPGLVVAMRGIRQQNRGEDLHTTTITNQPGISLEKTADAKPQTAIAKAQVDMLPAADAVRKTEKSYEPELEAERMPVEMRFAFRKKLKWEYFFSPMISNVQFGGSNLNKTSSSVVFSPTSKHDMNIAKKLGFITGTNVYYPLTKRLSFTSGAHLIYTGYDIYTEVIMPNTTSITFKDSKGKLFSKTYVSYYANEKNNSNANITNYNWQFSVPVGLSWDVYSQDNFKISIVSTVEPYMVLGSKAYLLSGDASSYVTDPDLIRKFNLSGNLGSMVSFSSNTVNWKIGPNFRYQILSTYNNIYPVKEHFVNYGIHVGVSKK